MRQDATDRPIWILPIGLAVGLTIILGWAVYEGERTMEKRVFLGGTCNGSTWRDEIIPLLEIEYFNPVVENWTQEDLAREIEERKRCNICLYVITPLMSGVYSIAEVIDDSNKKPRQTVLVILKHDGKKRFSSDMQKSLDAVAAMVQGNGGRIFRDLGAAAQYLNEKRITKRKARRAG